MMNKKIYKKSERYIQERITAGGSHLLRIQIRKFGQVYSESVKVSDFDTPKQAMQFAQKLRDEALVKMKAGYTVSKFPTVESLYHKSHELFPVRLKTIQRHDYFYRDAISMHGSKTIDQITSADIQTSINQYAKNHTKKQVAGLLAVWRSLYKTCAMVNVNVFDRTVCVKIPDCKESKPKEQTITSEDFNTFCDALLAYAHPSAESQYNTKALYYAVQVMRYTGLRPAETFALTKTDINLIAGYIDVNKASHSTADSWLSIDRTKTEQSKRRVPIHKYLLPVLVECLQWTKHQIVFADYFGNLMEINKVSDHVYKVARKAGIRFNLYMLRHQFATDQISNGTPLNVVRDLMGHCSKSMTLDYATSNETDRINAINNRVFS